MLKTPRLSARERVALLKDSELIPTIIQLGIKARYTHSVSGNTTRQGYMGCIIKLSNTIKKVCEADNFENQDDAGSVFTPEWKHFLASEVEKSNKFDTSTLGGTSTF